MDKPEYASSFKAVALYTLGLWQRASRLHDIGTDPQEREIHAIRRSAYGAVLEHITGTLGGQHSLWAEIINAMPGNR